MPNCLAIWRCISEIWTCNITCSPSVTDSMLTTFLGSPVKLAARSAARVDSSALATLPVSTTLSFIAATLIAELGRLAFIIAARSVTSFSTRMSRDRTCLPPSSKKKALVWPVLVPSRKMRRGDLITASAMSGLETRTSLASLSSSTIAALLSPKVKCWFTGWPWPVAILMTRASLSLGWQPDSPRAGAWPPRPAPSPQQAGRSQKEARKPSWKFSLGLSSLHHTGRFMRDAVTDDGNRSAAIAVVGRRTVPALVAAHCSPPASRRWREGAAQATRCPGSAPWPPARPGQASLPEWRSCR